MKTLCAFLFWLVFAARSPAQSPLDCSALQERRQLDENALLSAAPLGAARPTLHRLDVNWSHGVRSFIDVAPYGIGDEAGIRHTYCGYDAASQMHLIYRYNEDEVDGLVLNDSTGAVLPAGYTVVYTSDHRLYLAIVQPSGMDGQEWRIYRNDGRLQAKGPTGTCNSEFRCTEIGEPRWTTAGRVEAKAICWRQDKEPLRVPVRLVAPDSAWSWAPKQPCKTR